MAGFQVVIDMIRGTGKAATRVADGLRGIDCSAAVPTGDAGMPGARCVGKLAAVKQGWQGKEKSFVSLLEAHAGDMSSAADRYSANEQAAKQDITTVARPASGPRPF